MNMSRAKFTSQQRINKPSYTRLTEQVDGSDVDYRNVVFADVVLIKRNGNLQGFTVNLFMRTDFQSRRKASKFCIDSQQYMVHWNMLKS
jgi:hypothetical protein